MRILILLASLYVSLGLSQAESRQTGESALRPAPKTRPNWLSAATARCPTLALSSCSWSRSRWHNCQPASR